LDQVRDLLVDDTPNPLKTTESNRISINSKEEVVALIKGAIKKRVTRETAQNDLSSRSHAIFQVHLRRMDEKNANNTELFSTLTLVDLAGSERMNLVKLNGIDPKETKFINSSLAALSDVITAMNKRQNHIPYRNSKLTCLLQPYLGQTSKTICVISLRPGASTYPQT
jgi:hypothetical protein